MSLVYGDRTFMICPLRNKFVKISFIFILIGSFVLYFYFRPEIALLYIFGIVFASILLAKLNRKVLYLACGFLILFILVYSFFHFRGSSWDAFYYMRNALLLKQRNLASLTVVEKPYFPYLGEFFLALIWKFLGFHFMNLSFGVATLVSLWLTYLLFKELTLKDNICFISLLLLFSSPMFLEFIFSQYKVELFLLVFVLASYIFWVRILKNQAEFYHFILLGVFLAFAVLVKVSFLPFAVFIILTTLLRVSGEISPEKRGKPLVCAFILLLCFALPLLFWIIYAGGIAVPYLGSYYVKDPVVHLTRDSDLLEDCEANKRSRDYGSLVKSDPLWKQPYFYLSNSEGRLNGLYSMFDPGIFLYLSILLFPLYGISIYQKTYAKYLYFYVVFGLSVHFIFAPGVFWYIIFIFPFLAPLFPSLLSKELEKRPESLQEDAISFVLEGLFIFISLVGILMAARYFDPSMNLDSLQNSYLSEIREQNFHIASLVHDGYLLDASEHRYFVNLMFLPKYDEFVIRSNCYFAAANKSLQELYKELTGNNIRYIAVHKDKLLDSWYQKLPRKNNEILLEFLDEYTVPIYPEENPFLFEIL